MDIVILAAQILGDKISTGGDRVFVEMARRWCVYHRVTVICPEEVVDGLRPELPATLLPLPRYPLTHSRVALNRVYLVPLVYLMRCLAALACLRRCRGDVLVLSGDFFCDVIPAVIRRGRFRLLVANVFHINESLFRRKANPALNTLVSFLLQKVSLWLIRRRAGLVLLLNHQVAGRLKDMGFAQERLRVVGAGLDVKAIERVSPIPGRAYDAVFFGRFNPTKGCFDLPAIWKAVTDQIPGARLGIIGAGNDPWRRRAQQDLKDLGIDPCVEFLGFLPYEEAYGILKASSVLIAPSYEEGWGITICEAFACGIPVVAYDLPVYDEVFPLVLHTAPLGDRETFGKRVVELLRDRETAACLARAGRAWVARYDWEALARREIDLFEEAMQSSPSAGETP
ncbi:MAG: glycosyltransferase [Candidatus Latescibacteria bacterium]|nr:glycosyltransferase [Candidatus Latescibacterota bacterium]